MTPKVAVGCDTMSQTKTAVITGANSGIGHAFAEILVMEVIIYSKHGVQYEFEAYTCYEVHALDINVGEKRKSLGCRTYQYDLSSESFIHTFAGKFKDKRVGLLLNIAGMYNLCLLLASSPVALLASDFSSLGLMEPHESDSLTTITYSTLLKPFRTNTFALLLLIQALLPTPRIGLISSRVGSISDNSSGGSYAYHVSKAALNSMGKSMAMALREKGVLVVLMHFRYVNVEKRGLDTRYKIRQMKEAVESEEAVGKLWELLMATNGKDTWTFWHREGRELPW